MFDHPELVSSRILSFTVSTRLQRYFSDGKLGSPVLVLNSLAWPARHNCVDLVRSTVERGTEGRSCFAPRLLSMGQPPLQT